MSQDRLKAAFIRGGTSKAVVFRREDLPADETAWPAIFLAIMGSPDPNRRQLDGMGGGISSVSKVCVVGPSARQDADVDYTFAQIGVADDLVDFSGNCGNMSSAIGPFAVDEGMVQAPSDGEAQVRIYNTNTRKIIVSRFRVRGGTAEVIGDMALDGVAGTGAPIRLEFVDPGGAGTGRLLPSGAIVDRLAVPGLGPVEASMVDAANPCVFVHADAVGKAGTELPEDLDADTRFLDHMEAIRRIASVKMGIAADPEAAGRIPSVPKVAMVAGPKAAVTLAGADLGPDEMDIAVRMISIGQSHRAVPLTGALCLAVASRIPGSVPNVMARGSTGPVRVGHASGLTVVDAAVEQAAHEPGGHKARYAAVYRTSRRLFEGHVLWPGVNSRNPDVQKGSEVSVTRAFVDHLHALWREGLDRSAAQIAADLFLDGCAIAVAGAREAGPSILADFAAERPHYRDTTSLLGSARRASPLQAARVNGAAMHVLDFEPMWSPANHAISTVLPALLALSEMALSGHPHAPRDCPPPTGERLLTALAVGIEAQGRLRVVSEQLEPAGLVFHPPGVVGPIGSAAACGFFAGLDAEAVVHAIGIAASQAGTILANVGSMTKALHCGQAAAAGLDAALLAGAGFTADRDALGGPRGYCRAFFGAEAPPASLTVESPAWHMVDPGPAFKLYPSQYATHFVIRAALEARAQIDDPSEIDTVTITVPPMPYVDRPQPDSGLSGKFSFQYTAAVALLDGDVTIDSFSDRRRFASDMRALLERIILRVDPGRSGQFKQMQVDVDVALARGKVISGACDGPPGSWGRPVPSAALKAKAELCLRRIFPADRAAAAIDGASHIAEADGAALRNLLAALTLPENGSSEARP